ncbi:MAG: MBL fold metallo-hydrolase [Bacteroidales bacterium]|nr:MBL fold metallo-hydrolase [Bacteroidales bacterium]
MNIQILRGSKQIGGSCVELTANNGQKILIDIGIPLDVEKPTAECLPNVDTNNLMGILISHSHADHYGLGEFLDDTVPYYLGKATADLMKSTKSHPFSPKNIGGFLVHQQSFNIGPFKITPYLVDHSSYDAYAFVIECDGKTIIYSGDFRFHGRKGSLFTQNLKNLPQNADIMLMEGSCLGRDTQKKCEKEIALEPKFVNTFQNTKGAVLISTSSQNIDRIVTIYKACKKTGRQLVISGYCGHILQVLGNQNVPNFHNFHDLKKFKKNAVKSYEINENEIATSPEKYVVILDKRIFDALKKVSLLNENTTHIYSMWEGYKETTGTAKRLSELTQNGVFMSPDIHTSGHADIPTLQKFVKSLQPKILIPIHTFYPEQFMELFGQHAHVNLLDDGVYFDVNDAE